MPRRKKVVTDADLVAAFVKKEGVTRCPMGQRRHSERQYRRAEFGEIDLRSSRHGRIHGAIEEVAFTFNGEIVYRRINTEMSDGEG